MAENEKDKNRKRLYRNIDDKKILGVCSGIADYFYIDPVVVRVLTIILALAGGSGIICYLICAFIMPVKE